MKGRKRRSQSGGMKPSRVGLLSLAGAVLIVAATAWWQFAQVGGPLAEEAGSEGARGASADTQDVAGPVRQQPPAAAAKAPDSPAPLWQAVDEAAVSALPPYGKDWSKEGRALVRASGDVSEARTLQVGDRLTLSVPQLGEVRSSSIEEVSEGAGARSLLGKAAWGDGLPRRWVVTVGQASLFAWIDTPAGPHELAVRQQPYGWLVPSVNKMAGFDFSEPDYFVLDGDGRRVNPRTGR